MIAEALLIIVAISGGTALRGGCNFLDVYKGSFNVRISPSLHRKAVEKALSLGIPLRHPLIIKFSRPPSAGGKT